MSPYSDTNLFVRFYLASPERGRVDRLLEAARKAEAESLPITWLHRVELMNALEFSVWHGRQGGRPSVTSQQAAIAWATFREDLSTGAFLRAAPVEMSSLETEFERMAQRHTARHGFRTYDILHVAGARLLGCDVFWSFDARAQKLAELEGLAVPEACRS